MADHDTVEANGIEFAYHEAGDGDRLALCLHGFPDDAGTMDPLLASLADEGFRAVAPYMRGYAPTEPAPDGDYSVLSLAMDAVALADALDAGDDAILVGHDWGAIAAYAVGTAAPDRFSHLVGMAVPPNFLEGVREHPEQLLRSWYMLFFQVPELPEWVLRANDFALVEFLWRTWSPGWDYPEARLAAVKDTLGTDDTVEHALAYYRQLREAFQDSPDLHIATPTLVLAGETDGCIGPALFEDADQPLAETARVAIIRNAGHFLHQERPDVVHDEISSFVD